ncbi:hypothetical protein [Streptomyces althioticus]
MTRTAYTPSLPGLSTTDGLDTVINWGLEVARIGGSSVRRRWLGRA